MSCGSRTSVNSAADPGAINRGGGGRPGGDQREEKMLKDREEEQQPADKDNQMSRKAGTSPKEI